MKKSNRKGKQLAFRKKKKDRISFIILAGIAVLFMGLMFFKGKSLYAERQQLSSSISTLQTNITSEETRSEELKEYETYTHTKKYAEEVAKEVLGYVYEDEIVFKAE